MAAKLSSGDQKLQKEGRACLKRSQELLKKNSGGWDENKALLMGKLASGRNSIAEAYGMFKSLTSNILVSVPEVYFEAKKEEQREIANFLTDATNYDFTIGRLHHAMLRSLWRCFPYGFGPVAEQVETEFDLDKKGERQGIKSQRYFWRPTPNRDILFDPDGFSMGLEDHRYIFMAYYKSITEIKADKSYFNIENIEKVARSNEMSRSRPNQPGTPPNILNGQRLPEDDNPDFYQIKIWRMYDRVNEQITDYLDFDMRLVRIEDWPLLVKIQGVPQFPVKILALNTETDGLYPPSEVELIKSQLINLAQVNDKWMTTLTKKTMKLIGLSPYVDDKKLGKLIDQKNQFSYILTSNVDVLSQNANAPKIDSAADAVHQLPDVQVDKDFPGSLQEIRSQIQNILGYGFPSRGGLPAIRSAKEAARVSDAMQKSLTGRQNAIERFTADIALYHILLVKQAAGDNPDARYFRQTEKVTGIKTWLKYNPSEIPDEQDLFCDVFVGTSSPQTLDTKRAQFLQEFSVIMPFIEKMQLSPAPLLYRYAEVFQVRGMDQLLKNQQGAATMLLAALVRAGQLGEKAPPELLIKPIMDVVDSILGPAKKQQVIEATLAQGGGGEGGGGVSPVSSGPDPFKDAGNPTGAVDMGSPT